MRFCARILLLTETVKVRLLPVTRWVLFRQLNELFLRPMRLRHKGFLLRGRFLRRFGFTTVVPGQKDNVRDGRAVVSTLDVKALAKY